MHRYIEEESGEGIGNRAWRSSCTARRFSSVPPNTVSDPLPHSYVPLVNQLSDFPVWC